MLLLALSGCGASSRSPKQALIGFLQDSALGNIDAAYQRLSPEFRKRCDRACFVRVLDAQPGQSRQLLDELRAGEPGAVYSAEAKLTDGTSLRLERDDANSRAQPVSSFYFADNPLDFYPQDTPSRTLRSFVRAFSRQRFDVLTRFVPKSLESKLSSDALKQRFAAEPKITAQVESLRQHLDEPLTLDGNTARLPLGPEQEATLILEDGRWRVQKLQ